MPPLLRVLLPVSVENGDQPVRPARGTLGDEATVNVVGHKVTRRPQRDLLVGLKAPNLRQPHSQYGDLRTGVAPFLPYFFGARQPLRPSMLVPGVTTLTLALLLC